MLGSWQGNDAVQFVELSLTSPGNTGLADGGGTDLVFDDETASAGGQRVFHFDFPNPTNGLQGARILVATTALAQLTGVQPDYVLPEGFLQPKSGRVCFRVDPPQGNDSFVGVVDCLAYGRFRGDNGTFGKATLLTPDDRSLVRLQRNGPIVEIWGTDLTPTPQNNSGAGLELFTRCGDGVIQQGELCDGTNLGNNSCAGLGFAKGTVRCTECHLDATGCTACGDGGIDAGEECDGGDFGGKTCESLGFTGGELACSEKCKASTRTCDPTYFVPGDGPRGPECLAAWKIANAKARPGFDGKVTSTQRCKDGDPGCDADATRGTCTFTLGICFDRADARLARKGRACARSRITSWTLLKPTLTAAGTDGTNAATLVSAVAALGATVTGAAVTFAPPLESGEICTASVTVVVPTRGARPGSRVLKARTVGSGLQDGDVLKLVCQP